VLRFDEIEWLRANSPAWKLLCAGNAPLVLSFLEQVFVTENVRSISAGELESRLDDVLYALNQPDDAPRFPRPAKAYLDDWAAPESGWLRKYYPQGVDEPHFDATPAAERALRWVRALGERSFVGTESRLNTIFILLRQMVYGAATDPEERLRELRRQRQEIDEEITRVEAGDLDVLEGAGLRDRYQQLSGIARELLSDFREVEDNFRRLDRGLREKVATWHGGKGELLDDVLGGREAIAESDQGKSFQAFFDLLLSQSRQEELSRLLASVHDLEAITDADLRLRRVHYDWLDAAERTQGTVRLLSEQLRHFLDEQMWAENRRVLDIVRGIESRAIALRGHGDAPAAARLDGTSPAIALPMERPLYTPSRKARIISDAIPPPDDEADPAALFTQVYVDPGPLRRAVLRALRRAPQAGLAELVSERPLRQGLAELIAYLSLSDEAFQVVFDDERTDQFRWTDAGGRDREATVARVTFARVAPAASGGA
jgi:flagellar motility protein MotE (MotC chaperone)